MKESKELVDFHNKWVGKRVQWKERLRGVGPKMTYTGTVKGVGDDGAHNDLHNPETPWKPNGNLIVEVDGQRGAVAIIPSSIVETLKITGKSL